LNLVFIWGGCGLSALVRSRLPAAAGVKVAPEVALFPLLQVGQSALRASGFNPCRGTPLFLKSSSLTES